MPEAAPPNPHAVREAYRLAAPCVLCPRRCGVDRLAGEAGFCGIGAPPLVSSIGPHFGEEPVLVGRGGSGTLFLAGCNLACVYCQNAEISHLRRGRPCDVTGLVKAMLDLQHAGCVNVNFVTPTHVAPWLLDAIVRARRAGCRLPVVWNCGGYESVEMLRRLDGWVDIYMPDVKYADPAVAERLSSAADYPSIVRDALREMHRQVGDLRTCDGVAARGLLVRHLVLPHGLAGSDQVIDFLATEISPQTTINVMAQYRPEYRAGEFAELSGFPDPDEVRRVQRLALDRGLRLAR